MPCGQVCASVLDRNGGRTWHDVDSERANNRSLSDKVCNTTSHQTMNQGKLCSGRRFVLLGAFSAVHLQLHVAAIESVMSSSQKPAHSTSTGQRQLSSGHLMTQPSYHRVGLIPGGCALTVGETAGGGYATVFSNIPALHAVQLEARRIPYECRKTCLKSQHAKVT